MLFEEYNVWQLFFKPLKIDLWKKFCKTIVQKQTDWERWHKTKKCEKKMWDKNVDERILIGFFGVQLFTLNVLWADSLEVKH